MENHRPASKPLPLPKFQRVFDEVWKELTTNGTFSGPANPQTPHGRIARRAMLYEIRRQVMSCANDHRMSEGEITRTVVRSVSTAYRCEPASLHDM